MTQSQVLVITPTRDEYRTLCVALGARDGVATLRLIDGSELIVHVAAINGQGQSAAYAAASGLLEKHHPSLVILSGIAGVRFDADMGLFDCVAAVSCIDYSVSERLPNGKNRPTAEPMGPTIRSAESFISGLAEWESGLVSAIERELAIVGAIAPAHDRIGRKDITARNLELRKGISDAVGRHAMRTERRFMIANVCSGNDLHKDADYLQELVGGDKRLVVVEMEFANTARACNEAGVPCLMIRAISDIVGYKKKSTWALYAAQVAAAGVKALLTFKTIEMSTCTRAERVGLIGYPYIFQASGSRADPFFI